MKDDLGNRMKSNYEMRTRTYLPRRTYTILRLDGKAFHTFTKGMKRPYDEDFISCMDNTAMYLCQGIQGCQLAYVQSDEISLLLTDFENINTDAWFDGQVQKMVSVAASLATSKFNQHLMIQKFGKLKLESKNLEKSYEDFLKVSRIINSPLAHFDARVFCIPDPVEVENYFVWRQKDAIRNSISMHAQSLFSHKELHGKSQADMHDMIHSKGENWNNLPDGFKRGRTFEKKLSFDFENGQGEFKGKVWEMSTIDFLKEREEFSELIPKISHNE